MNIIKETKKLLNNYPILNNLTKDDLNDFIIYTKYVCFFR